MGVLAGVLLKLGGYGVFRSLYISGFIGFNLSCFLTAFILWGGGITSFICLSQSDLKCLVAYSSVGHMALLVAGILTGNWLGAIGGLILILGHGLCSSFMFVLASLGYDFFRTRRVVLVKGIIRVAPFLGSYWFVFCSANIAAPPTINFGSELLLIISVLGFSGVFFFSLIFMSFLVGGYSLYLFVSRNHGRLEERVFCFSSPKSSLFLRGFVHGAPLVLSFFFFDLFFL